MIRKSLFIILMGLCSQVAIAAQSLDGIVATVNDAVITQSEVNETLASVKKQMVANNMDLPPANVLHKQVLDQLVNKKLQIQAAELAGLHVTDEEVDKAIDGIAKEHKLSVAELYKEIATQGIKTAEYRQELHDEILMQQIQQREVASKITIGADEINDMLRSKLYQASNTKEYHLEDILISLPDAPSPEQVADAKKRADTLLDKIHKGLNFAQAAVAESGNTNALQGGDLGWRKLPEVPSAFADQLVHLQQNEVMGPIQTPNGFHLVRLAGLRSLKQDTDQAAQKQQIQQLVYQRKLSEGMQNWLTRLRSAAAINLHPEV